MILVAVAILGGVGLVFAILIALAQKKLHVWEDPRIDAVTAMLPGANCGACGVPGCRAFAEKVVAGEKQPAGCNVSTPDGRSAIASYLGVDAGSAVKVVARMLCAGGTHIAEQQAENTRLAGELRRAQAEPRRKVAAANSGGPKGPAEPVQLPDDVVDLGKQIAQELEAVGKNLTRASLTEGFRTREKSLSNDRAGSLLNVLRAG